MLIPAYISYFTGYLTITLNGRFCERFINVCASHNILLWDIKRISEHSVRCKISVPAFRKIKKLSYDTGVLIHINAKHGFPFLLNRYRKRKLFLLSGIIFICVILIANQFVWSIEIRGNYKIPTEKIISALNTSGLKIGMPKKKINQQELKKDALLLVPELAWLWVDKKGSKIIVDVRENIETPSVLAPDEYYNIVSSKDGLIKSMVVKEGVPVVNEGDTVLKGTVLVTGKIPVPAKELTRYVKADATILARVWYEKKELFSKISTTRHETGKKKTHYSLKCFGKALRIFHNDSVPFSEYDVTEEKKSLFKIELIKKCYREIILEKELITEQSLVNYGSAQLKKQIEEEVAPNSHCESINVSHRKVNDTTMEVCVQAEYTENIALSEEGKIEEEEKDLN